MAAVAPGVAGTKTRRTKVRRAPYWVPWDNDGAGKVRLLPVDTVHTQVVKMRGEGTPIAVYEAKGFVPLRYAPPEAHRQYREMQKHAIEKARRQGLPAPDWTATYQPEKSDASDAA